MEDKAGKVGWGQFLEAWDSQSGVPKEMETALEQSFMALSLLPRTCAEDL